mmetsp:Transcript_100484/g.299811  ORF Transcript_100484/g.299811 Transcript_100484/m.299811 type:complete len:238 (+) Transcript_100484:178-891(+)
MVAFAKSSENRRERMCVPQPVASRPAILPPFFSACRIWLMITAAVLCRMSASNRRSAAMSASAARMSATTLSGTAFEPVARAPPAAAVAPRSALPTSVSFRPVAPVPSGASPPWSPGAAATDDRRLLAASSLRVSVLLSHVRVQRVSKRCCFVCESIASTSSLTGCSACRRRERSLASTSSIRISTWQQFTSTSRIHGSRGSGEDSSFWTMRCAPCLIISRTQARRFRPLLTRPSVS